MLTRRSFIRLGLGGAIVSPLLGNGDSALEAASPIACDHDLRLYDSGGRLLGSWGYSQDIYGEKVCCRICGRFYAYLPPDVSEACWYHPWDTLDVDEQTATLRLLGEERLGDALSIEQAIKVSEYFQAEHLSVPIRLNS